MIDQERARENLLEAKNILDGLGVPFFLSNGTLLGCYREGKFIEYDEDIDIGVKVSDFDDRILEKFITNGFELVSINGERRTGLEYSFHKREIGLDIFFYIDEEYTSWMAVWAGKEKRRIKYVYPLIRQYQTVAFLGSSFRIPINTEEYLEAQYGDWRAPEPNWDCFISPLNIEKDYWRTFYLYPHTLEPSDFAKSLDFHDRNMIDLGCGNGRDTFYFQKNGNNIVGIDQYVPANGPFRQFMLEELVKTDMKTDVIYCRFLLHAISADLQDEVLKWAKVTAKEVYIECRSDRGVVPDYSHDRRLINAKELIRRCIDMGYTLTYFIESTGLAKTDNEDPVIIRLHLKS